MRPMVGAATGRWPEAGGQATRQKTASAHSVLPALAAIVRRLSRPGVVVRRRAGDMGNERARARALPTARCVAAGLP